MCILCRRRRCNCDEGYDWQDEDSYPRYNVDTNYENFCEESYMNTQYIVPRRRPCTRITKPKTCKLFDRLRNRQQCNSYATRQCNFNQKVFYSDEISCDYDY